MRLHRTRIAISKTTEPCKRRLCPSPIQKPEHRDPAILAALLPSPHRRYALVDDGRIRPYGQPNPYINSTKANGKLKLLSYPEVPEVQKKKKKGIATQWGEAVLGSTQPPKEPIACESLSQPGYTVQVFQMPS
jgi:hypothetical protein